MFFGASAIHYNKQSNTCSVLNKEQFTGDVRGNILYVYNKNRWNRESCSAIGEGEGVINALNKKQVITNNCRIVNGSEQGKEKVYINHGVYYD